MPNRSWRGFTERVRFLRYETEHSRGGRRSLATLGLFSVPEPSDNARMNICPCCKQSHDSTACQTPDVPASPDHRKIIIELIPKGMVWAAKCGDRTALGVGPYDAIRGVLDPSTMAFPHPENTNVLPTTRTEDVKL